MSIASQYFGARRTALADFRAEAWRDRVQGRASANTIPLSVAVTATLLAVAGSVWSSLTGSMTLYGDARAHLDVARHVSDAQTPGLAQLGSVWLPLPHLAMVPFVAVEPLWHSGIAGAIVSGAAFIYSAIRIYGLTWYWTESKVAGWCAFLLYATSLNLLYVQTTALTEPLLLAMMVGAMYHFARWLREMKHRDLALAAFFTMLATISRYDGWVLLAVGLVVVVLWTRFNERRAFATQANVVIFCMLAGYGILLWFVYNLVIFGDPLYFIHSSASSQAQQLALAQTGMLGTKGNIVESVLTYFWAVFDVSGIALLVVGAAGGLLLLLQRRRERWASIALLVVLASPVAFNVVALWSGQSTVRVPERALHEMWNLRYGLMALPLLAFAGGTLAARWKPLAGLVLAAAVAGVVTTGVLAMPITVTDGRMGVSSATAGQPEKAAEYVAANYQGGRILVDDTLNQPLMFRSGLNLREFVTVGNKPYYQDAMTSPGDNVSWLVVRPGDDIDRTMKAYPARFQGFTLVTQDRDISVYRRF